MHVEHALPHDRLILIPPSRIGKHLQPKLLSRQILGIDDRKVDDGSGLNGNELELPVLRIEPDPALRTRRFFPDVVRSELGRARITDVLAVRLMDMPVSKGD